MKSKRATIYIADDGKKFITKAECYHYEESKRRSTAELADIFTQLSAMREQKTLPPAEDFGPNIVQCEACGEILESKFRHDFVQCKCPNLTFTDGGREKYRRHGGMDLSKVKVLKSHPMPDQTMSKCMKCGNALGPYGRGCICTKKR